MSFFCAVLKSSRKILEKLLKGFMKKNKPCRQKTPRGATPGAGAGPTRGWALGCGRGRPCPWDPASRPSFTYKLPHDLKTMAPLFPETLRSSAAITNPKFGAQDRCSGTLPEWRLPPSSLPTPLHQPSMTSPTTCEGMMPSILYLC